MLELTMVLSLSVLSFCVRSGKMVVCPGDCEACPLICQENPPVMYTRCGRCDWLAYGRLDALLPDNDAEMAGLKKQ